MPSLISSGGDVLKFRGFPSRFGTAAGIEIPVQEGLGVLEHHFTLSQEGEKAVLESAGGAVTTVNGEDVRRSPIHEGDRIQVGDLMLIYSGEDVPVDENYLAEAELLGVFEESDSDFDASERKSEADLDLERFPFGVPTPSPVGGNEPIAASDGASEEAEATVSAFSKNLRQLLSGAAAGEAQSATADASESPPNLEPSTREQASDGMESLGALEAAFVPEGGDDLADVFFRGDAVLESEDAHHPAAEGDLADVFLTADEGDEDPSAGAEPQMPQSIDVEIPAIPDFEEAEKAGATVALSEGMGNEIKSSELYPTREKPLPPIRAGGLSEGDETVAGSPPDGDSERDEQNSGWVRRTAGRFLRRRQPTDANASEQVATQIFQRGHVPIYGWQVAWHKVAIAACLAFACVGAYMATSGHRDVEKYLALVGLASQSQHPDYLRRLQASDPEFLFTLNAERMVRLYDKWADGEEWRSVAEIDDLMGAHSRQFRLSDLDWVSVARNGNGGVLAVITKKKRFSRRALVHDFGRGLLQHERVGEIAVHDGFVGANSEVKFALLDPRTLVIGDPDMTIEFLQAPVVQPSGDLLDQPAHALADAKGDWLGVYYTQRALKELRALIPAAYQAHADTLIDFLCSERVDKGRLLARIGVDIRIDADYALGTASDAATFASGWNAMADIRLTELMQMLGPHGKLLVGAQTDLAGSQVSAEKEAVRLKLTAANRWLMQESKTVKSTFMNLLEVMRDQPILAPTLISQEEAEARITARQVVHKYEMGLAGGSEELKGLRDVAAIVEKLAAGVRGGGAYRKVIYRVPRAREYADRIVELLEWSVEDRLVVDTSHQPGIGHVAEKMVASQILSESDTDEP